MLEVTAPMIILSPPARTKTTMSRSRVTAAVLITWLFWGAALVVSAAAAPLEPVSALAAKEKAPFLGTLKDLVSIESGSGDREGLDKISTLIADKLTALGGEVEFIEPDPANTYRMIDTPKQIGRMVHASFVGTGTKKIMLIAHMDTVYLRGMLASSRSISTAIARMVLGSPMTSKESPSSCTRS